MQRRALLRIGTLAVTGGSLLTSTALADQPGANLGIVSVKDPQFGAVGDRHTDDTAAIQAAVNYCFGDAAAPHGAADVYENRALYFPPGRYKITSPIKFEKLSGGRILGSGRFVTQIMNDSNGPVFVTNGCGYSHFEGLYLRASDKVSAVFDLNWDGDKGGMALQSNAFIDILFDGGACGVEIGAGGFMGSENVFINCFWIHCAVAGFKTSNFNALQNTIVGGNFQSCNIGVWVYRGSVTVIESVGFQVQREWDIRVDNSANDTINILGCRSESPNFVLARNYVHVSILGCTQAAQPGYFLHPNGCPTTVERCVSIGGQISLEAEARLCVRGSSFGRKDWLSYEPLYPGQVIELEDIEYGGTPNSHPDSAPIRIAKQRITDAGVHDYSIVPAGG